jgi:thiol-disulfide isomerase/thioredoxin
LATDFRRRIALAATAAWAALLATGTAAHAQTVTPLDAAGLKKQVAAHKGKVVVVNFWATWCGPCVQEFPDLVKLYKNNKAKGLELITISADEPTDGAKVKAFLGKNGLSKGYLNKSSADIEGFLKYLEPTLSASASVGIPRTYVIDRNGKIVKALISGQTYSAFQSAVTPYLAKK